ncbi:hypothetical protein AVEN_83770-1 [Araneus ventricosus]|uniref:Integrase p58-like C-terminal domain-containing protein n=2 Tax=Araneus ventricosus TaxID=182803 RepID=A0A4Y2WZE0_ARAVE|nr:hypothetical protein AVEN_83770-1 [Araneus ventricosus]
MVLDISSFCGENLTNSLHTRRKFLSLSEREIDCRHPCASCQLEAQQRDKDRYDSKHRDVSYNPGDLVWVFTPVRKVGLSEKLLKRYFGPYRVVQRLSDVTYEVEELEPSPRRRKTREVVHVLRMKKYYDPVEQEQILTDDSTTLRNEAAPDIVYDSEINDEDATSDSSEETISYKGPITRSRTRTEL